MTFILTLQCHAPLPHINFLFCIFNKESELTFDQIAHLLRIPSGNNVKYELPENEQWLGTAS
jgi:hypothetical protein